MSMRNTKTKTNHSLRKISSKPYRLIIFTRAVESASLKVGKSLKIAKKNWKKSDKNRIKSDKKSDKIGKSEKSDLIEIPIPQL